MMQGMLHFVSAAFHCALQIFIEDSTRSVFNNKNLSLIYHHHTTSDDSGVMATLVGREISKEKRFLDEVLCAKTTLGRLLAIHDSPHKVLNVLL